ncbi:FecCD family ABC transporter permease [Arcanobacterium canis]
MTHSHRRRRVTFTYATLITFLTCAVIISASTGQFAIAPMDVLRSLGVTLSLSEPPSDPLALTTLWTIRFPRIALGVLVGAALAVAGTIMQAVFSNPLAEPSVIGVSSGAAVGASAAIVFFPSALAGFAVPLSAFACGLIASFVVYTLARSNGRANVLNLVLTGIAVTAVCTALTSIATYIAPTTARDQIVFWQMGSLSGATWKQVCVVGIIVVIGAVVSFFIAGQLDTLALGESAAGHLGIHVQRLRIIAIVVAALLTAAAVSYAGVIAFVGLVVPHILRLVLGPLNRYLVPAVFLGGAVLITVSDLVARNLIPFADLPIGIFTSLLGGPTFFVLLRSRMRRGGMA